MKKQKDVKEILRLNGVDNDADLSNVLVIGGYYETYVIYTSGATTKIVNAEGNTPEDVTRVSGSTGTVTVPASGETYFFINSGISSTTVNGYVITYLNGVVTISGETLEKGETFDTKDGKYYTYFGNGELGTAWRILDLNASGATGITIVSLAITASRTGDTISGTFISNTAVTLTATGTYDNGYTTNLTDDVKWTSSRATVASVTTKGIMTPKAAGTATITATYVDPLGSTTVSNTYTATILGVTALQIIGVPTGDTAAFTYSGSTSVNLDLKLTYSDSSTGMTTDYTTWTSSNTDVATVNATTGALTYVATGSTTVTASYDNGISSLSTGQTISFI